MIIGLELSFVGFLVMGFWSFGGTFMESLN